MKKILSLFILCTMLMVVGCSESIDSSARYVFTEETIISYLEKHPQYSTYVDIVGKVKVSRMSQTTIKQLLSARGNYTVFAPTNEAILLYLEELTEKEIISAPNWEGFYSDRSRDSIYEVIAYNSVIDGGDMLVYEVGALPVTQDAEIPMPNMYDRKLSVHWGDNDDILINNSPIDVKNRDIPAINGVIHAMNRVVAPSNNTMGHLLNTYLEGRKEGFRVAAKLVKAIGMLDELTKVKDEEYENLYLTKQIPDLDVTNGNGGSNYKAWAPEHRYYGFTYFAETDEFWERELQKEVGQIEPEDVMAYLQGKGIYPDAKVNENYQEEDNLLNLFVTYHLLPEKLTTYHLVYHYNEKGYSINLQVPTVAMAEFYTTMGKRRLLKIFESKESNGVYLNRFPELSNGRRGSYHEVGCLPQNEGVLVGTPNMEGDNNIRNGMIYPIDKLLVYDDLTRSNMGQYRIRWDVSAMFPELINNDCRMSELNDEKHKNVAIPPSSIYQYLEDCDVSDDTYFFYWTGRGNGWHNYLGDEFNIQGMSEVTMKLPPVPIRGTYELRFAVQSGGARGMVQFYWGTDKERLAVQGIPLDIRLSPASDPIKLGYQKDTEDDDYNAEIDKAMRNNGFMKGSELYCAGSPGIETMARADNISSRRIIVRQTMDPDETYYIRFKTVLDDPTRQFYMDYLEYAAKEVYDNPETPEDIW